MCFMGKGLRLSFREGALLLFHLILYHHHHHHPHPHTPPFSIPIRLTTNQHTYVPLFLSPPLIDL